LATLASLQSVEKFAVAHVRLLASQVDQIAALRFVQFYDLTSGASSTMTSTKGVALKSIEGLIDTDKFLKVPRSGTFKNLSGFYGSARLYIKEI
jgi:hypothetical protein